MKFLELLFHCGLWSSRRDRLRHEEESTALPRARCSLLTRVWFPPASPRSSTALGASLKGMGWAAPGSGGDGQRGTHCLCTLCKHLPTRCWDHSSAGKCPSTTTPIPPLRLGALILDPFAPPSSPLIWAKQGLPHPFSSPPSFRGWGRISSGLVPLSKVCGRKERGEIVQAKPPAHCWDIRVVAHAGDLQPAAEPCCAPPTLPHTSPGSEPWDSSSPMPPLPGTAERQTPKRYPQDLRLREGKHQGSSTWCSRQQEREERALCLPGDRREEPGPSKGPSSPGAAPGEPHPHPKGASQRAGQQQRKGPVPRGRKRRGKEGRC